MTSPGDRDHSESKVGTHSRFEVVADQSYNHDNTLSGNSGLQVVPDDGKQVNFEVAGLEVVTNDPSPDSYSANLGDQHHQPRRPRQLRRRWLIFGAICAPLIIVTAILGGVLGWKANKKSSSSSSSSNANIPIQRRHNLAALSFALNSVNNTLVYYQDNTGEIVEAASSTQNTTWIKTKLGFFVKNGSAIGAAIRQSGFTHEITVLYTDSKDLIHNVVYNSTTDTWVEGDISNQNFITSPDASLSVTYCRYATRENFTVIAYQDVNGFIRIGDQTPVGWILAQAKLNPINNTGLALQFEGYYNQKGSISLYYQMSNLSLSSAWWPMKWPMNSFSNTLPDSEVYDTVAPGTPLAAAIFNSNPSVETELLFRTRLLSQSTTGIEVETWSEFQFGYFDYGKQSLFMAKSIANFNTFGAMAITDIGQAFVVISTSNQKHSIESWQLADDTRSWTSTGTVDIGSAWD